MSKEVKRILTLEESREPFAYQDQYGYWTIAIGRLIDKRKGGGLRDSEIDMMLDNDMADRIGWLLATYPWMSNLSQVRFDAMVLMSFQLGKGTFAQFTGTLRSLQIGDYKGAANGMRTSLWAKQTPGRVARLSKQVETNTYQYKDQ